MLNNSSDLVARRTSPTVEARVQRSGLTVS